MTQANPHQVPEKRPDAPPDTLADISPDIPPDKTFNLNDYLPEEIIQILREVRNQRLSKNAE